MKIKWELEMDDGTPMALRYVEPEEFQNGDGQHFALDDDYRGTGNTRVEALASLCEQFLRDILEHVKLPEV